MRNHFDYDKLGCREHSSFPLLFTDAYLENNFYLLIFAVYYNKLSMYYDIKKKSANIL